MMTLDQILAIRQLRQSGYAVCIFTPDEMPDSNPSDVEDRMCEAGWQQINHDTPDGKPISA